MSFLSWYNHHHDNEKDQILSLIHRREWEKADFVARTDPLTIRWKVLAPDFWDETVDSKILPLHAVCRSDVPVSFLDTLHEIDPDTFGMEESAYERLPLHIACMGDMSEENVIKIIEFNPSAANEKDSLGRLPIHYACKHPNLSMAVAHLLRANPGSINTADKQGFLPIHVACRFGMPTPLIRLLLAQSPTTVFAQTSKGSTVYQCARAMKGEHRDEVMRLIARVIKGGKPEDP